jgi:glycosyltransferase involved in cell wall biosynthesis
MTADVAVVLISKNQAWNIARLIESVLKEKEGNLPGEILLVDSASTDETTEIASRYPITVLKLWPGQRLTAAAGRHVGYQHTSSAYVLFLDGDMELCQGWLEKACQVMWNVSDVAVVTSRVIDLPKVAASNAKPLFLREEGTTVAKEVPYGGGAALYRRAVLEEVGTFNPYIYSDEEPDLCIRIRHAGYRVVQLECPIAYHYSDPDKALPTLVGRWKRRLYLGAGQNLRYHLGSELFWPYFRERGYGCIPALGLVAGLFSFVWSFASGQWLWFSFWLGLLFLIITVDAYRKRSLYRTAASLLERTLIVDGTIRGFFLQPLDPKSYSAKFDIVKMTDPPAGLHLFASVGVYQHGKER